MEDILALREEKSHLIRTAEDMLEKAEREGRAFTDEEKNESSRLLAESKKLDQQIADIEDHERRATEIRDTAERLRDRGQRKSPPQNPTDSPRSSTPDAGLPKVVHRYGSLKAYKGDNAEANAYRVGQWLLATQCPPSHALRFRAERWCKEHGVFDSIQNALGTNVSVSGGNLVPDEMSQAIIDYRERYGIFRQWADVMPMGSDHQIVPTQLSVLTASFAGENSAITESESTYSQVTLTAKKLGAITRISTELSEDSIISIADRVTYDLAYAFALKEDQCGFVGDGTSTYGGIRGITKILEDGSHTASWYEPNAAHDYFSEIDNTDLTTTMARLPQWARDGAAWFCSSVAADAVFGRLKAAGGGNTISELAMAGISALGERGIVGAYLGYPIVTSQVLPSVDTSAVLNDKVMLLFGNLRLSSMLGERRAISLQTSDQRYWEYDQVAIKATERIDINNHGLGTDTVAGAVIGLRGSTS